MRSILITICILLSLLSCASADNKLINDKRTKRFLIPVFQYSGNDREKNLKLTKSFAKEWQDVSGFEYLVKDKKIAEDTLRSGSLIPSTNYSIDCEFHELGAKVVLVCKLKDLENGEIISSDSYQGKDISQIESGLRNIAKNLYSGN